jgi:flagellar protein FlaI
VLFQSLATGHGGLCTIHAEDVETAIKRLTQPPMNIPPSIISLMNCMIVVKHVRPPAFLESGRRLSSRKFVRVAEVKDANTIKDVFLWNPSMDSFQEDLKESYLLSKTAKNLDVPLDALFEELERRKQILLEMVEHNIRDFRSVSRTLSRYYKNPHLVREEFLKT